MPRTRSIAWSQLKVGIIGVVAMALVVVIVFAVGGEGGFFWERYALKARFDDVAGLKAGAVVRLSGKEVGTVTAVEFVGNQVEVGFELLADVRPLVTDRSTASIGSLSLLGEPIIDLTTGVGGTPLNDDEYVAAGRPAGSFEGLTATASASLRQMDELLADIRSGQGTLGKLVTDDALYTELQAFVGSAGDVTRALNQGRGTLGGLLRDPKAFESLNASLTNLRAITARINSGQGALGRFLNDEAMGRSMAGAAANTEAITGRISRGEGTVGKLLSDQQLYDRLTSMTNRVDEVVAGLETGRGTAGRLLQDQELYENMNTAVLELRDLLAEVRKDPRKYLNVRVSIF
jgi:phospholipid/cholesterol/gamma-HCH transport system substrate-binding protein